VGVLVWCAVVCLKAGQWIGPIGEWWFNCIPNSPSFNLGILCVVLLFCDAISVESLLISSVYVLFARVFCFIESLFLFCLFAVDCTKSLLDGPHSF